MLSNKELMKLSKERIQKGIFPADIAFTAEEAEEFLTNVVDQSFLKNNARVVMMAKEKRYIRALGLGTAKVLHPATFTQDDYIKAVKHQKIELSVSKARGCVMVYDDDLEDNIEGEKFADHLMNGIIAPQVANELEYAFLMGDKAATPTCLDEVWDGWYNRGLDSATAGDGDVFKKTTVYDASSDDDPYVCSMEADAPYGWKFKLERMLRGLPSKYRKNRDKLRFIMGLGVADDYRLALAARGTAVGDAMLIQGGDLVYGGVKCAAVPLLPETLGTGADETFVMLTPYENLIVGLHRSLKMETERVPSDEATRFWLSLRADVQLENTEAVVIYKKMKVRGA